MSVSLLPSTLLSTLRGLLHALSTAPRALAVSEARTELGALLKLYGSPARLAAIQMALAQGAAADAAGAAPSPSPTNAASPTASALGSKALEAWLSEEVAEVQRREPARWPLLLAKVLEAANAHTAPTTPAHAQHAGKGADESMVARFGSVANLSLRHMLSLALQLHRSPLARLQSAGQHFVSQQLSWALTPSAQPDKAWWALPDELLAELAQVVASPSFPLDAKMAAEQRQQLQHTLSKLQAQHRDSKQRDESADLQAGVSAHVNGSSAVADVLQDLGYSISSSIDSLKDTLHPFPKLTEQDVASIIVMILRTQFAKLHSDGDDSATAAAPPPAAGGGKGKGAGRKQPVSSLSSTPAAAEGWQIPHVIDAINELSSSHSSSSGAAGKLNWRHILENEIDHPRLMLADERSFSLYVDIYRYATTGVWANSAQPFHLPSLDFLLRDWKHSAGHHSMLRWALPSALTLFSYLPPSALSNAHAARNSRSILAAANTHSSAEQTSEGEDESTTLMSLTSATSSAPATTSKDALSQRYQSWLSFDLLESLLESVPSQPSAAGTSSPPTTAAAQSLYASLRSLLSLALERCPELLMTGLLSVRPKSKHVAQVKDDLLSVMMPVHLAVAPHAAAAQAFGRLWTEHDSKASLQASKAAVFWIVRYWMSNSSTSSDSAVGAATSPSMALLPPVLISLGNSLRSFLERLLSGSPTAFTIDLQSTSGGATGAQAVLSFHQWVLTKVSDAGVSAPSKELFLATMLSFVKEQLSEARAGTQDAAAGVLPFRLSVESAAVLLKTLLTLPQSPQALSADAQSVYSQYASQFQQLQASHMQQVIGSTITLTTHSGHAGQGGHGAHMTQHSQHPSQHFNAMGGAGAAGNIGHTHTSNQLNDTSLVAGATTAAGAGGATGGAGSGTASGGASDEIEEEANGYFQRIYTGSMSLDAVVEMLLRFRSSSSARERDVCLCMIHNLFDEYRFFSRYPLKELQITGLLFGALVQQKLVAGFTLGIALRFVLEALRSAPDTKMWSFGLWAIGQFKQRIHAWPQYAMLILHIPHMQAAQPEIAHFLQQVVINAEAGGANAQAVEHLDFSPNHTTAFGFGFHSDAQSFSTLASLTEAERYAELQQQQASAAKTALDRASASANLTADTHLPPGLGLGAAGKPGTPGPGPALAASLVLGGGGSNAPSNPAGAIGGARPSATAGAAAGGGAPASSFGSTLNIDSLLSAEGDAPLPLAPSEGLKDKIHFIINALSFGSSGTKSNLRQKGRELKLILRPEYLPYFSRYLVIKRVSIEANFQRLYASFLDYVGVPSLRGVMLETTYYNIAVLLRNDKIVSSSSERSLLKNLGSWLGLLTLARNKPIRAKYLDVKTLILEAYDSGRLIAVIPFVAKVLESCAESRVFRPPNPWLLGVVGLLREIFELPGLKLNLKFEIEVLFNHLMIHMKEVKSTMLLQHRKMHVGNSRQNDKQQAQQRAAQQQQQQQGMQGMGAQGGAAGAATPFPLLPTPNPLPPLPKSGVPPLKSSAAVAGGPARSPSPSMSEEEARAASMGGLAGSSAFGAPGAGGVGAGGLPLQLQSGGSGVSADALLLPNLSAYVVVSPSIVLFQMYPALKRCVPTAIDRAIREIINPVVERSLAIACVTSRELIIKDFALEPDENKMRAASNSMVANLTSSLALVTCKEPLRVSITNHLSQLLEQHANPSERALVERACLQVAADNLELGTTLIEKAAAERAIREIDEQLAPVYQIRLKHRQTTGQPYVDLSFFQPGNRYPAALPEALRAKPGVGLQPAQLRVYDFSRIRSQHAAAAAAAPQTGSERPVMKEAGAPGAAPLGVQGSATSLLRPEDADKKAASAFAAPSAPGVAVPGRAPGVQPQQVSIGPGGTSIAPPGAPGAAPSTRSPPLGSTPLPSNLTAQQTLDKLLGYLATLEQAVLRFPNHKSIPLHSLTTAVAAAGQAAGAQDQEINVLMRLMAALLTQTARDESNYPKDLVPLTFALKVFKRLYERENRSSLLQIDVHIGVLKCVRSVCPKLLPELTAWLLYGEDDRKFILPITAGLLRARLLNTSELDLFLSKLAMQIFSSGQAVATTTQPNPAAPAGTSQSLTVLHPQFEFILTLVRRVVVKRPIVSVTELTQLLETLSKIGQQAAQQRTSKLLSDHVAHLLEDVRTAALLAEKERSEQERAARAGVEGMDSKLGGVDPSLLSSSGNPAGPGLPLALLDSDAPDVLDRLLESDDPEPPGLRQQVLYLLDDWLNICLQAGAASDKAYSAYLSVLQQQRLLATPDATQKFFRCIIQLAVDAALSSVSHAPADSPVAGAAPPPMSFTALDALAKLFVFLLKFLEQPAPGAPHGQNMQATSSTPHKLLLLRSYLSAAVYVLRKDQAMKSSQLQAALQSGSSAANAPPSAVFNQRPYLRLFTNLLHDLHTPDPLLDSNNSEVLALLATHFRLLRPQRCPAFLFAWMELIAHRMFLSKLLLAKQSAGSALLARLLVDLLRFLQPYLRAAELTGVLRLAYKGTLRILLVLLHDFPEFLCEYHSALCDVIPASCIQLRNLILSAFPRSMRLPDPFTPNLKVDLLPDMGKSPAELCFGSRDMAAQSRSSSDAHLLLSQPMHRHTLLIPLEHYLKHREPASFFTQMLDALTLRSTVLNTPHAVQPTPAQLEHLHAQAVSRAGTTYNVPLLNALVMYTGLAGIQSLLSSAGSSTLSQFQDSAAMDVYEALLSGLDAEGRYLVLNALANQLRFPNNHTHYFSCVLLYLYLQAKDAPGGHKDEVLMEQMTRVLLERLIVHRPHPWGLLITFIELIKNPRYDFWRQPFTRCAPEIEKLFESVARSCMPAKAGAPGAQGAAGAQGAVGTQPGAAHSAALGSSVGAGNAAAAHQMLLSAVPNITSPRDGTNA